MNVLSLFDGKSSGYTACELAGIEIGTYYSAEVDKYAIKVSDAIHPNQIRLGDVTKWREWDIDWSSIDMIFGGFPCQAWSMAGKQMGDKDERGMLFWTMLDIMKHVRHHNPKADFLIENVKMKKEFEEYITHHTTEALGEVHKILINSALVSAQNRNRYYWTSFDVTQPEDTKVKLTSILECSKFTKPAAMRGRYLGEGGKSVQCLEVREASSDKSNCLTTVDKDSLLTNVQQGRHTSFEKGVDFRPFTLREKLRLQTVPEVYIDKILSCGVPSSKVSKIAGNGWTDELIAHILGCMK